MKRAVLFLGVVIAYQVVVAVALALIGQAAGQSWSDRWDWPLMILCLPATMAAALWSRRDRQGVKPLWSWAELSDRQGWWLVPFTVAANFSANVAYVMLTRDAAAPELNQSVLRLVSGSAQLPWPQLVALFIGMVILAPLSEEWLFRGVLQGAVQKRWGPWVAIPVSAVVFGGFHGVSQWAVTGFYGLVLGWVAHRRKSLTFSMIAHGAWNLFVFLSLTTRGL